MLRSNACATPRCGTNWLQQPGTSKHGMASSSLKISTQRDWAPPSPSVYHGTRSLPSWAATINFNVEGGKHPKVFVGITTEWTTDGKIIPTLIRWEGGRKFAVDRVLDVRQAASLKIGGAGIRCTIRVRGKETFLFREQYRWFVEASNSDIRKIPVSLQ